MKTILLLLLCGLGAVRGFAAPYSVRTSSPAPTKTSSAVYDVRTFGAKGDGTNMDTVAIQTALDACLGYGGTVTFPPGVYLIQPLSISSKTTLLLQSGATLLASTNQADFMRVPGDWLTAKSSSDFIPLIGGKKLLNVSITGGGVIDGNGAVWWEEAENARQKVSGFTLPRPNLMVLEQAQNLRVENITLKNSPKFHLLLMDCDGVLISNVTVLAPERAANTDAIDPSSCRNVLITQCKIDVGDDNIAIKAGKKMPGREFASENITITDCAFLHGHGVSIGSETAGGVHNVTVHNCSFTDTENGLRIKSSPGKGGIVENITYDGITMTNVNPAIIFTCFYASNSAGDATSPTPVTTKAVATKDSEKIPYYRNIQISNLTATCPKTAGIIEGLVESCITNVVLENVTISAGKSFEIRNANGIQLKNVSITGPEGLPFQLENAEVAGLPEQYAALMATNSPSGLIASNSPSGMTNSATTNSATTNSPSGLK